MPKHIWGYWDCKCGRTHIRGDITECPGCGLPRLADTKFYVDKSVKVYVPDTQKNSSSNWMCDYCSAQNEASTTVCKQCGASRGETTRTYFDDDRSDEEQSSVSSPASAPVSTSDIVCANTTAQTLLYKMKRTPRSVKLAIMWTILAGLLVALLAWLFIPVEHQMTIEGFSWQRSITVEELKTYNESGWSLPPSARLSYSRSEFHHNEEILDHYDTKTRQVKHERISGYEEVITGYKDLGNGQFEEQTSRKPIYETYYETEMYQEPVYRTEPVYQTKYYYEIDRWVKARSVNTSSADKNPYWGEVTLADKERRGSTSEQYYVNGHIADKFMQFSINYSDWINLSVGRIISFTTFRFGDGILSISDIEACVA